MLWLNWNWIATIMEHLQVLPAHLEVTMRLSLFSSNSLLPRSPFQSVPSSASLGSGESPQVLAAAVLSVSTVKQGLSSTTTVRKMQRTSLNALCFHISPTVLVPSRRSIVKLMGSR